jgi:hypothetical protein
MKVQLSGRLGNQLFEMAHGFGRANRDNKEPEFIWDIYSYPEGVSSDVLQIPGINLQRDNSFGLLFKCLDKLRSYSAPIEKIFCKILRVEREHNQESFSHPIAITGYFQDFQWAEKSYSKLNEILSSMADANETTQIREQISSEYQVFHYRSGDYLNHPANFGVLNREYYLQNMDKKLPVVIVTDSLDIAKEKFDKIGNIYFVDPGKSNAWQAISILSKASHVVSSNSTLSWWGAFFAVKAGGTAVLPFPFFANGNPVQLYHPEFKRADALFD